MMDPTTPKREVLYEFQDDIIFYEQIGTHKEDNKENEINHL